jgi:hypothetical protein
LFPCEEALKTPSLLSIAVPANSTYCGSTATRALQSHSPSVVDAFFFFCSPPSLSDPVGSSLTYPDGPASRRLLLLLLFGIFCRQSLEPAAAAAAAAAPLSNCDGGCDAAAVVLWAFVGPDFRSPPPPDGAGLASLLLPLPLPLPLGLLARALVGGRASAPVIG